MSYDLEIATGSKPEHADVMRFLSEKTEFFMEGTLSADGNLLVGRHLKSGDRPCFTVDGPFAIEPDDLAEALMSAVLAPKWLIQISIPAVATKMDAALANRLARHLAERRDGAVYDPQTDGVIWPKGKRKRYKTVAKEERIRLICLSWFLPFNPAREDPNLANKLLTTFRRFLPEAVPSRFGTFEPLQGRLEPGDDDPFLDEWRKTQDVEWGDTMFWKSSAPCFGGSVSFPDSRDELPEWKAPPGGRRAIIVKTELDGRALHGDERWSEACENLFVATAKRFGAFYGGVHVERNVIANRGNLWYAGDSESRSLGRTWWCGIGKTRTWLTWFGPPYKPLVEEVLRNPATYHDLAWLKPSTWRRPDAVRGELTESSAGLSLRIGDEPMDHDQLKGLFPKLPADLLAGEKRKLANVGRTVHVEKIPIPADVIPNFQSDN